MRLEVEIDLGAAIGRIVKDTGPAECAEVSTQNPGCDLRQEIEENIAAGLLVLHRFETIANELRRSTRGG